MSISAASFPLVKKSVPPPAVVSPPKTLVKKVVKHVEDYEMAYKRFRRVRSQWEVPSTPPTVPSTLADKMDAVLTLPEMFKNTGMRRLVGAAKLIEELAESCGESNAYIERVVRNLFSAGDKFNFTHPLGGGIGRVATSGFYLPGIAVHKVLGAGFYALSVLCSGVAFGLSKTSYGERLQLSPEQMKQIQEKMKRKEGFLNKSLYSMVSTYLVNKRTALFNRLIQATSKPGGKANSWVRSIARYYTKNSKQRYPEQRKHHSNYMWKNLHEYGPLTQGLMKASYNTLLWVNRLGGSFDKYFGSFLAKNGLNQSLGDVLGNRVGLLIGISISAGLSTFIAPLAIGTSYVAAMACGLSLLLLLAAKANVIYNHDWYGSSSPPIKVVH